MLPDVNSDVNNRSLMPMIIGHKISGPKLFNHNDRAEHVYYNLVISSF